MKINLRLFDDYWNNEKKKFDDAVKSGDKAAAQTALSNMQQRDQSKNGSLTANTAYSTMSSQLNSMSSPAASTPKSTKSSGGSSGGSSSYSSSSSSSSSPDLGQQLNTAYERGDWAEVLRLGELRDNKIDLSNGALDQYRDQYNSQIAWANQQKQNQALADNQLAAKDRQIAMLSDALSDYEDNRNYLKNYDFQDTEEYRTLLPIYQEMYRQLGEDARKNTLADASGLTGGLTNSYAIAASQQANNDYNSKFTQDVIPQLMDLAYNRYANGANFELSNLNSAQNLLSQIANADQNYINNMYNFNRANRSDYESDRNFNEGVRQYDQNFDYQQGRDKVADDQWLKEFEQQLKAYQDSNALQWAKFNKSNSSNEGLSQEEIDSQAYEALRNYVSWQNEHPDGDLYDWLDYSVYWDEYNPETGYENVPNWDQKQYVTNGSLLNSDTLSALLKLTQSLQKVAPKKETEDKIY